MRYYLIVLCFFVVSTLAKHLPSVPNEVKIDSDVNWRIIGGENAGDGEYPHMVSLRGIETNYHRCGGVIVHEEWVITAAHCIGSDPRNYIVVAGTNKLNEGGDVYKLLEIHSHELYDFYTHLYDVAIVKVEKIKFNDKVKKIKLEKIFVGEDVPVTLSGWGVTISENGEYSNDLQHLTYKTTSVEECKKRVIGFPIEDTQICTLHRADVGGCVGDSGSPLIRSVDDTRYVVGIVSWGPDCGSGYYPDIFTRVSSFVSWFNEKCNCNL